ncbi:MAG: hypothetical protein DI533_20100 [Cereibacter sphaeroides]|uniref:Uncharacterized protein n=1 Tax=Cereibacter sphaeroides TaxID=1063 RepID=A0A2W5S7W4_CERSP|nr:MAG: hypothetical protein DI533_20100 [Cereibacter sphaeroides]
MSITAFTAYKDTSGKLHTSLESVQTAERRAMYADLLKAGTSANPQLARLDPTLVVDFCMALGKSIGDVANDRLTPIGANVTVSNKTAAETMQPVVAAAQKLTPATPARKLNPESVSTEEKGGRFENAPRFPSGGIVGDRAVAKSPALGLPYGRDNLADMGGDGPVVGRAAGDGVDGDVYAAVVRELGTEFPGNEKPHRTDFGRHPLDPSPVDEGALRVAAGVADRGH